MKRQKCVFSLCIYRNIHDTTFLLFFLFSLVVICGYMNTAPTHRSFASLSILSSLIHGYLRCECIRAGIRLAIQSHFLYPSISLLLGIVWSIWWQIKTDCIEFVSFFLCVWFFFQIFLTYFIFYLMDLNESTIHFGLKLKQHWENKFHVI